MGFDCGLSLRQRSECPAIAPGFDMACFEAETLPSTATVDILPAEYSCGSRRARTAETTGKLPLNRVRRGRWVIPQPVLCLFAATFGGNPIQSASFGGVRRNTSAAFIPLCQFERGINGPVFGLLPQKFRHPFVNPHQGPLVSLVGRPCKRSSYRVMLFAGRRQRRRIDLNNCHRGWVYHHGRGVVNRRAIRNHAMPPIKQSGLSRTGEADEERKSEPTTERIHGL